MLMFLSKQVIGIGISLRSNFGSLVFGAFLLKTLKKTGISCLHKIGLFVPVFKEIVFPGKKKKINTYCKFLLLL